MSSATGVPSRAPTTTTDSKDSNPSIISGHVQYAKGYAEETIGKVTGSKEWIETGKKDTEQAIQEMKEAGKNKGEPDAGTTVGKVEEFAGQVTGCGGMEGDGKERISKATSGNPAQSIG